ncbi:DUF1440 domain-containing protein [Rhodococcus ruber]|uniref:DUF1440 domain-containing protein n=1 Tax=Rhodococcus ruber TaxID=1830 RepID=A0A098BPD3_9NOCA|nr:MULTISPECIES: hypothetical protein [Rhodococcus]MCD2129719.1 DUF1440 domain-containing protein [Rhodococcus ruber]MCZ1075428.1 DUF1440 domain-containing protein [Rhodococcus sp. A5(2022)]MCZ4506213.1 DUF1440 domain-containing protein [Rhodococcus ruber]MCZ4533283.1 DUF1440 domain-containing protein [Rhodococcus ruber]MCZ4623756.1 DUF1440 domain-containing protein [Rhodococcus ruber]
MKTTADLLTDAVIAPVAGYAATKVMEPVSMKLYQLESDETRRREDAARPGSPSQIAADKTLGLLGIHLDDKARERAGTAFHYGLAISWAPVYALLRRTTGLTPVAAGLASGAAMSLIVDEGITPLAGFSAPNRDYPAVSHLRGFAAHLAFGIAVAAVTETAWTILGRRPVH